MSATREAIIETACALLERQGFHATGLNALVKESGAPRGSLYHHFPEGKDAIAEAAIARAGRLLVGHIAAELAAGGEPVAAIRDFVRGIANAVEASAYRTGGPLATVAMETAATNERLNRACRAAYAEVRGAFAAKLRQGGLDEARAAALATVITAAIEGGVILCRTDHSGEPLRLVADHVGQLIAAELAAGP